MVRYAKKVTIKSMLVSAGLLVTFVLTACGALAQHDMKASKSPAQAVTLPLNDAKLQNYQWQLNSVTDSDGKHVLPELMNNPKGRLHLKFTEDNRLQFFNTCNQLSANYILTNHDIELSPIMSTRMACDKQGAAFDVAAAQVVQGQFKLTLNQFKQPVLTVYGDGHTAIFHPVNE